MARLKSPAYKEITLYATPKDKRILSFLCDNLIYKDGYHGKFPSFVPIRHSGLRRDSSCEAKQKGSQINTETFHFITSCFSLLFAPQVHFSAIHAWHQYPRFKTHAQSTLPISMFLQVRNPAFFHAEQTEGQT